MTTEAASAVEVKAPHVQNEDKPEQSHTTEEQQSIKEETIRENGNEDVEATGDAKPQAAEIPGSPTSPAPTSPTSSGSHKKEKRSPDGKGISRFIPPWLRKQKSQSQDEGDRKPTQETGEDVATEREVKPEEEVLETERELQEQTESQLEDVKIDDKEENKSTNSADTQPAKEDGVETEKEVTVDEVEKKGQEATEESKKDLKEGKIKTEKISQKPPKKLKTVLCKVILLDRTEYNCEIEKRAKGQVLFDKVCEQLNLLEKDYFGLTFQDNADQKNWVDPAKGIKRQIRSLPWLFGFNVKFYPPDPSQLTEDITRYFLCLQLRQDIASGRLPCSFVTHALLGSYTLQAELGDYDPEEHSTDYINEFQFAPTQTKELEEKVVDLHKSHRGLTPAQADMQFVDNAKKLSMYGVDLHHAKDSEAVDIMLGISASGLLIYKDRLRINRFAWPKILKISYKRNNFYIKVRPGEQEQFESTIGFKLPNHRAAKRLWKVCVEHHTFFRLKSPDKPPKTKFLTLGSKFRYSGRTQAETQQASTMIDRPAPYFERTSSKRISRSLDGAPMGSITDQSLLNDVATSGIAVDGSVNIAEDRPCTETSHLQAKVEEVQPGLTVTATDLAEVPKTEKEEGTLQRQKDLDKTQDDLLKHQASISELKRSFMESSPEPRPNEWEKRRIAPLPVQAQGSLEEEITTILFSRESFSANMNKTFASAITRTAEGAVVKDNVPSGTFSDACSSQMPESSPEIHNIVVNKAEIVSKEAMVNEREKNELNGDLQNHEEDSGHALKLNALDKKDSASLSSSDSSESEDESAEYRPDTRLADGVIEEEIEEQVEDDETYPADSVSPIPSLDGGAISVMSTHAPDIVERLSHEAIVTTCIVDEEILPEAVNQQVEEEVDHPKVNGDASHFDVDVTPQIIFCSEPPVVKTEMVTISDASQKTEICTKEVPIVQTETKTITYEASQVDGGGDNEPGVLMSAQTITSESVSTTTTTHITKTVKGGVSETRIEKRIVITGDADIDHDEALAQAIKEAKELHPDMSVTRVVVHKETELTEEEEEE